MINFLSLLKAGVSLLVRKPREVLIGLLAAIILILAIRLRRDEKKLQSSTTISGQLPPGTKQIVTVFKDRVVIKTQLLPGKIEYRDRYLPPEGHIEFVTKDSQPNQTPEVRIKDFGLTFRLGGGIVYSERLLPEADVKFAYWRRYGALIGMTKDFGSLGICRHVDDFTPFPNLELMAETGLSWQGNLRFGIGLRTNF